MYQHCQHQDTLNMVAYGLSKFGGTIPGTNRFASLLGATWDGLAASLVNDGLITGPAQLAAIQGHFDTLFLNIAEVWQDATEKSAYLRDKASIDRLFGTYGAEAYAAMVKRLLAAKRGQGGMEAEEAAAIIRCYALQDGILREDATEEECFRYETQWLAVQLAARKGLSASVDGFRAPVEEAAPTCLLGAMPVSGPLAQAMTNLDAVLFDGEQPVLCYKAASEASMARDVLALADVAALMGDTPCGILLATPNELRAMAYRQLKRPILQLLPEAVRPTFKTGMELWTEL